jgi:molybdopterin-guanine dinucleotide biosynthesis protein A
VIAALRLEDVAISANGDPSRFADYECPIVGDGEFAGEGPLAGVLAGLEWAFGRGATALLTVPGDTPFVPRGLADALSPPPARASSDGRVHHLIALWPIDARVALRGYLSDSGSRHVGRFADMIGMRRVDFPRAAWDAFYNVNTPADLEAARSIAREADARGSGGGGS